MFISALCSSISNTHEHVKAASLEMHLADTVGLLYCKLDIADMRSI